MDFAPWNRLGGTRVKLLHSILNVVYCVMWYFNVTMIAHLTWFIKWNTLME